MINRALPAQLLAAALCLAIPISGTAAQFQGEGPVVTRSAGAVMPGAQIFATPAQLGAAIDLHFPSGFSPDQALATLSAAQAKGAQAPAQAAASRALISAVASPNGPIAASVAAALSADQQARLSAAASAMQRAAADDPDFSRALAQLRAAAESPATAKAASRLPSLLKRAAGLFKLAQPDLIAVPGGPGNKIPGMTGVGLMPAGNPNGAPRPEAPRPTEPVSKRVTRLQGLAKSDAAAALKEASAILSDGEGADPRLEVRVAAIRVLGELPGDGSAAVLTKAAGETSGWYERREAARQLGLRAAAIQGAPRAAAVEALKGAVQARNASLRLMAAWALERFGEDPKPLLEKGEKLGILYQGVGTSVPVLRLNRQEPPQKQPKKPSLLKRLLLAVALGWLAITLMNGLAPKQAPTHVANPPAVTQQVEAAKKPAAPSATAAPAAKPAAVAEAPKPTQEQSLDQIAKETKRTADAMEKLAQAQDKPQQSMGSSLMGIVLNVLIWIGVFGLITWLIGKMRGGAANQVRGQLSQVKNKFERPDTTFNDVAGIDDARAEIEEIADYLHNPAKYKKLGARVPKGVLLDGPPGTGKTLLARALAGESGATFISVSGSDFIEMFVGVGASRVRELFNQAKQNKPAIIFIDELDAVAKRRDGAKFSGGNDEREQTVNAILAEMSGFEDSSGVIVIAATNRADVLDPAITRPGRFDRKIHVGLPDVLGREAILQVHARKARLSPEVDLYFIAKRTAGLSGAFLEGIVNEAALLAARRGAAEISQADMNEAVDRATIGAKRNLFMPEALKRRVAFHESGHVIAGMLAGGVPPNKVTVIPHGAAALGFAEPGGQEDRFLYTQDELEARLVGILGGLAAEKVVFGNTSTGPDNDLEQATRIARMMVERLGMSEKVGYAQTSGEENAFGQKPVSQETAREVDLEVKRIVGEAQKKALEMLTRRRDALDKMAAELLERETLSGEDAQRIVGPTQ